MKNKYTLTFYLDFCDFFSPHGPHICYYLVLKAENGRDYINFDHTNFTIECIIESYVEN